LRISITRGILPALLLASAVARAQPPDVRVRLLTLYRLTEATVTPGSSASTVTIEGKSAALAASLAIKAGGNSVVTAEGPAAEVTFAGDFEITSAGVRPEHVHGRAAISAQDGLLRIVARFPVEEYVAMALQGETAGNMPPQALKAMAVAIRSYTAHFRDRHKTEGFDFCDTTHCQFLRTEVTPPVRFAVQQTSGELLWDRGTPLAAYYHKACGGQTESAATVWPDQKSPALPAHDDPYCVRSAQTWRSEITRADLNRALSNAGLRVPAQWSQIVITQRTPSGRARTLHLIAGSSEVPLSASSLRFAVGRTFGWSRLKSDWYEIAQQGDLIVFTGKGVGHGVGMCQTGAEEMAREGKSYREILGFYYAGAALGRSAQGMNWITRQTPSFDLRVVNSDDMAVAQEAAGAALEWAEQRSGMAIAVHPVIQVYPTVAMFRDSTGEPGWVAASTRGNRIRLQPPGVLAGRLSGVLRHELLHLIVEGNARTGTPLWFREGLVVLLAGDEEPVPRMRMSGREIDRVIEGRRSQDEMQQAYGAALALVRDLERTHGRAQVIAWLRGGLPAEVGEVVPSGIFRQAQ